MIGIFDSGIGGVTVLKELLKDLPNEDYVYYSDSINNPYGDKDIELLKKIVSEKIEYFINIGCKLVVIACNTASTLSNYLRDKYSILIVAIEPAYKMVYDYAYNKKTLVMATSRTINSKKFRDLFQKYNNNKTILLSCSGLADLIEKNDILSVDRYLKDKLSTYVGVECVVLGCTHYPLIKENIKKVLGNVEFFDGSIGVSKQTKKLLIENDLLGSNKNGSIKFIDSSGDGLKEKRFFYYLNN